VARFVANEIEIQTAHSTIKSFGYIFSLPYRNTATMADNEEDLVDYDEEEEEQNVAAEEAADAEGKEVKK